MDLDEITIHGLPAYRYLVRHSGDRYAWVKSYLIFKKVHIMTVRLTSSDGFTFSAYVAQPAGKPKGAVVVLQEIFGVNAHIKEVADGYAAAGYLAVAPAIRQPGLWLQDECCDRQDWLQSTRLYQLACRQSGLRLLTPVCH